MWSFPGRVVLLSNCPVPPVSYTKFTKTDRNRLPNSPKTDWIITPISRAMTPFITGRGPPSRWNFRFDSILSSAQSPSRIGCIGLFAVPDGFLSQRSTIRNFIVPLDHNILKILYGVYKYLCRYIVTIVYIIWCIYLHIYIIYRSFCDAKPLRGCNRGNWRFSFEAQILKNERLRN